MFKAAAGSGLEMKFAFTVPTTPPGCACRITTRWITDPDAAGVMDRADAAVAATCIFATCWRRP